MIAKMNNILAKKLSELSIEQASILIGMILMLNHKKGRIRFYSQEKR